MSIWVGLLTLLSSLVLASATGVCLIKTIFVFNGILFRAAGATVLLVMIVESAIVTAVTAKGAQLAEGSSERTIAGANMMKMKWNIILVVLLDK